MTDPEKKRKLEEIKRKRRELMEQLHQSEAKKAQAATSVEEEAKRALENAKKVNIPAQQAEAVDQTAKLVSKLMKSKKAQDFKTVNFTEEFPAYKPELYDEATQWYDEKSYEEEDSENDEEKEQVQAKPREPLIFRKNKQVKEEESKLVEKKYEVIPEEERETYLKNYKDDINEFLKPKKKYMERALNERKIYDMFLNEDLQYTDFLPDSNNCVHPILEFYDESCAKKAVTSLEWSVKYPELLLACYSKRTDDFVSNQKNGLIYIWSLAVRNIPDCPPPRPKGVLFTAFCFPRVSQIKT